MLSTKAPGEMKDVNPRGNDRSSGELDRFSSESLGSVEPKNITSPDESDFEAC